MNYILFDSFERDNLLPFTFTRPVADIRVGIMTLREKWEFYLSSKTSTFTQPYLSKKYPLLRKSDNVLINASVFPTQQLVDEIIKLQQGEALYKDAFVVAMRRKEEYLEKDHHDNEKVVVLKSQITELNNLWEIYSLNHKAINNDFELLTKGRHSQALSETNFVKGDSSLIFLEKGAKVEFSFLNTEDGPIYIGKNAEIMEGAKIRGPFALCEHSTVKMDAKIYSGTTIGPHSKVGGEINNSVIFGYTNKAHDGFLGNSVLGEWCNIGADTNVSNLKNTYDEVKLWSYSKNKFEKTGRQFCGLMLGDHSKCGINTMFNTGTVVGVNTNIFGAGYQRNFIPSFAWGGVSGFKKYKLKKAFEVADAVFKRRNLVFDKTEQEIFIYLFNKVEDY